MAALNDASEISYHASQITVGHAWLRSIVVSPPVSVTSPKGGRNEPIVNEQFLSEADTEIIPTDEEKSLISTCAFL